jgi:hypothetical protein
LFTGMTITNVSLVMKWPQGFAKDQSLVSRSVAVRQAETARWSLRPGA